MTYEALEALLLSKTGSGKSFPFGDDAAVFKVAGKMFALIAVKEEPLRITLKADPAEALAYRDAFPCIKPGYHMNKRHWNTITLDECLDDSLLEEMIDTSYKLVVATLPKRERQQLETD